MKALVLGDDSRSFIATVRALGRRGIEVHAAPADFSAPALRSRYISKLHAIPPWMHPDAQWLAAMLALLQREAFDIVIPCNETTLLPLSRHRVALSAHAVLAIPDDRAMEVLFDKHLTRELAVQLGIPVAAGRLPRASDSAAGLIAELGLPLIVKPRRSYSLPEMYPRGKVRVIEDRAALAGLLARLDPARDLLEGFVPGRGAGLSVLAHRGRILQAFEHHRVRETMAGSYYRVSAPIDPARLAAVAAMVQALDYTGLAMFEFRIGADPRHWWLLEVNARPWGSLPLPLAAGIDFPGAWVRLLTSGVAEPARAYRPGIYARNLLPDLRAICTEAAGARTPRRLAGFIADRGREVLRLLRGRAHQDMLVLDDPAPGLAELGGTLREAASRLARRLPLWRKAAGLLGHAMALRRLRQAAAGPARSITFVCDGNICRSPFAALALQRRLRAGPECFRVDSAGMAPRPDRASPLLAVRAARAAGIDLSQHRSRYLTRELAEAASALVVFEEANRRAILARYPDLATPILLLGALNPESRRRRSIADPVDGDLDVFTDTYRRIEQALDGIPPALTPSRAAIPAAAIMGLPDRPGRSTR